MVVQTQTAAHPPAAQDEPGADLQRPQRVLPAALPEQVPQPHRHPGLPEGQHGRQLRRVGPHLQAHHPLPQHPRAASAPRRARSTAGATRSTRPSPSATATATPATRSSRPRPKGHEGARCRSRSRPPSGKRVAVIGSGPAGAAAAYYLAIAGHEVTVYERDPAPGGMLRYGIPQYRLPKDEVLAPEYEGLTDLGIRMVCDKALGRDFTVDDLQNQGFDAVCVAIGCYDTNKLGDPRRGCRRRPRRPRVPAHRHARPALPRPHGQARGGHRRRLHVHGLHAHLGAPGRQRGNARLPPRHEGHARRERGPRGHRGGRAGHLPGSPNARPDRRQGQRHRRRVPAHGASARPTPRAGAGPSRSRARSSSSTATGSCWPSARARSWAGSSTARTGVAATKQRRLAADAVTFATGRPGVFGTGDVRVGATTVVQAVAEGRRAAYAIDAYLKGQTWSAIRTRQTLAEPQPEFLSIVPYTGELKEPRLRLQLDGARGAQPELRRIRDPLHAAGGDGGVRALPAVHLRGDRLLRPAPPGHRVRHDAEDPRAGAHGPLLPLA